MRWGDAYIVVGKVGQALKCSWGARTWEATFLENSELSQFSNYVKNKSGGWVVASENPYLFFLQDWRARDFFFKFWISYIGCKT